MTRSLSFCYENGFHILWVGKQLWARILIKLFSMFAGLKSFFFPNDLKHHFSADEQRVNFALQQATRCANKP